jgi:hypothetical protein
MSSIDQPSARPAPVRGAIIELIGQTAGGPLGPEEAEFLAALRRIVASAPAGELWEKYRGSRSDAASRIFARYAD